MKTVVELARTLQIEEEIKKNRWRVMATWIFIFIAITFFTYFKFNDDIVFWLNLTKNAAFVSFNIGDVFYISFTYLLLTSSAIIYFLSPKYFTSKYMSVSNNAVKTFVIIGGLGFVLAYYSGGIYLKTAHYFAKKQGYNIVCTVDRLKYDRILTLTQSKSSCKELVSKAP